MFCKALNSSYAYSTRVLGKAVEFFSALKQNETIYSDLNTKTGTFFGRLVERKG